MLWRIKEEGEETRRRNRRKGEGEKKEKIKSYKSGSKRKWKCSKKRF